MFDDRASAGRLLAERLAGLKGEDVVVLAAPRGGVPVGAAVARALRAPLDVVMAHKIGAPMQPELAIGAVCDGEAPAIVYDRREAAGLGLTPDEVERLGRLELARLHARGERYRSGRAALDVRAKTAVLVDDGVATGWTLRAALRALRARGASRVIVGVPVAPRPTLEQLAGESDGVVCLEAPARFIAVGAHYRDFSQVSDDEVVRALNELAGAP